MNKKSHKKSEQCGQFCSILPICILVSILTAVLVTLVFSIAFVRSFKFEPKSTYDVSGAFKDAITSGKKDEDGMTLLNGEAIVDFFTSGKTGFIYATDEGCAECAAFGEKLAKAVESEEIADIYHYEYSAEGTEKAETSAREVTIGQEEAPVLLYVKQGRIHDRLDDTKSDSDLNTFLAKYK
ncbi:hypothetical protein J6X15_04415 [Candidatus Saccharibacteria bacterium]|nr:hypothetical protein [Candidatus Saccharibacteria bacterium]